jgi:hypothetical protein
MKEPTINDKSTFTTNDLSGYWYFVMPDYYDYNTSTLVKSYREYIYIEKDVNDPFESQFGWSFFWKFSSLNPANPIPCSGKIGIKEMTGQNYTAISLCDYPAGGNMLKKVSPTFIKSDYLTGWDGPNMFYLTLNRVYKDGSAWKLYD